MTLRGLYHSRSRDVPGLLTFPLRSTCSSRPTLPERRPPRTTLAVPRPAAVVEGRFEFASRLRRGAPLSAGMSPLCQHRPERPKGVDTLTAIVVVGVDQDNLGLLLQELQPGEP